MSLAAAQASQSIDWVDLTMGLAGGLALFLLGMGQITVALKAVAGDRLRTVLARLSSNRLMGALTGSVTTAIIQSSSVSTVLVVGFVSASLLSVTQAASVIIGANLGTTVTAQVIALDVTEYALGLLAFGAIVSAVARRRQALGEVGATVVGLGFVFLGLDLMSEAMAPLGSYQPFLDLVASSSSPLVGLALGAAFTGLVQSSSATTGIVIVMGASGLLDLETGIAVILGANIGTSVTAMLAAIGKSRDSWRAALVHVLVNVLGALVWIAFIGTLADLASWFAGEDNTGSATPQQFANAHTLFNLANTIVFLALLQPLVALTDKLVPDRVGSRSVAAATPAFLDPDLIETPVLALEVTRRELLRLGLRVREMFVQSVPAAMSGSRRELQAVAAIDDEINALHTEVVMYLREVSRRDLSSGQRDEFLRLLQVASELEHLANLVVSSVIEPGIRRIDEVVQVSAATRDTMHRLHKAVISTLDDALEALGTGDPEAAARVAESKSGFHELEGATTEHLAERLTAPAPQRAAAYSIEIALVEGLRRVHQSCRRIAKVARHLEYGIQPIES
ncbi:MAG: Na/Pi cotransporter family protein [Acidimicrobiia bacterium]|nr:Na/Pi cotransporter family protein [Acidimicrobiia bacterium]